VRVLSVRVLVVSFLVCLGLGLVGGLLFALVADRLVAHGIGTGLFVVGIVVLSMALMGATEPPQGWASRRRAETAGRRSLAARFATDRARVQEVSSMSLAVWGVTIGGALIGLSLLAFYVAVQ
jgi:MFS family permease